MISNLAFAMVGAILVYLLRNDSDEFGVHGRSHWIALVLATFVYALIVQHPGLEIWRYGAGLFVFAATLTAGHSMILSPPKQPCPVKPDWLEAPLMRLFGRKVGDPVGWALWHTYANVRYSLPMIALAWNIGNPLIALAGPITVYGYWPVAYWIASGEKTKFFGAAIFGAAVFGLI